MDNRHNIPSVFDTDIMLYNGMPQNIPEEYEEEVFAEIIRVREMSLSFMKESLEENALLLNMPLHQSEITVRARRLENSSFINAVSLQHYKLSVVINLLTLNQITLRARRRIPTYFRATRSVPRNFANSNPRRNSDSGRLTVFSVLNFNAPDLNLPSRYHREEHLSSTETDTEDLNAPSTSSQRNYGENEDILPVFERGNSENDTGSIQESFEILPGNNDIPDTKEEQLDSNIYQNLNAPSTSSQRNFGEEIPPFFENSENDTRAIQDTSSGVFLVNNDIPYLEEEQISSVPKNNSEDSEIEQDLNFVAPSTSSEHNSDINKDIPPFFECANSGNDTIPNEESAEDSPVNNDIFDLNKEQLNSACNQTDSYDSKIQQNLNVALPLEDFQDQNASEIMPSSSGNTITGNSNQESSRSFLVNVDISDTKEKQLSSTMPCNKIEQDVDLPSEDSQVQNDSEIVSNTCVPDPIAYSVNNIFLDPDVITISSSPDRISISNSCVVNNLDGKIDKPDDVITISSSGSSRSVLPGSSKSVSSEFSESTSSESPKSGSNIVNIEDNRNEESCLPSSQGAAKTEDKLANIIAEWNTSYEPDVTVEERINENDESGVNATVGVDNLGQIRSYSDSSRSSESDSDIKNNDYKEEQNNELEAVSSRTVSTEDNLSRSNSDSDSSRSSEYSSNIEDTDSNDEQNNEHQVASTGISKNLNRSDSNSDSSSNLYSNLENDEENNEQLAASTSIVSGKDASISSNSDSDSSSSRSSEYSSNIEDTGSNDEQNNERQVAPTGIAKNLNRSDANSDTSFKSVSNFEKNDKNDEQNNEQLAASTSIVNGEISSNSNSVSFRPSESDSDIDDSDVELNNELQIDYAEEARRQLSTLPGFLGFKNSHINKLEFELSSESDSLILKTEEKNSKLSHLPGFLGFSSTNNRQLEFEASDNSEDDSLIPKTEENNTELSHLSGFLGFSSTNNRQLKFEASDSSENDSLIPKTEKSNTELSHLPGFLGFSSTNNIHLEFETTDNSEDETTDKNNRKYVNKVGAKIQKPAAEGKVKRKYTRKNNTKPKLDNTNNTQPESLASSSDKPTTVVTKVKRKYVRKVKLPQNTENDGYLPGSLGFSKDNTQPEFEPSTSSVNVVAKPKRKYVRTVNPKQKPEKGTKLPGFPSKNKTQPEFEPCDTSDCETSAVVPKPKRKYIRKVNPKPENETKLHGFPAVFKDNTQSEFKSADGNACELSTPVPKPKHKYVRKVNPKQKTENATKLPGFTGVSTNNTQSEFESADGNACELSAVVPKPNRKYVRKVNPKQNTENATKLPGFPAVSTANTQSEFQSANGNACELSAVVPKLKRKYIRKVNPNPNPENATKLPGLPAVSTDNTQSEFESAHGNACELSAVVPNPKHKYICKVNPNSKPENETILPGFPGVSKDNTQSEFELADGNACELSAVVSKLKRKYVRKINPKQKTENAKKLPVDSATIIKVKGKRTYTRKINTKEKPETKQREFVDLSKDNTESEFKPDSLACGHATIEDHASTSIIARTNNEIQQNTKLFESSGFVNTQKCSTNKHYESKPSDSSDIAIADSANSGTQQDIKLSKISSFLAFVNTKNCTNKQSEFKSSDSSKCTIVDTAEIKMQPNTGLSKISSFLDYINTKNCTNKQSESKPSDFSDGNTNNQFKVEPSNSSDCAIVDLANNGIQQNTKLSEPSGFLDFINTKDCSTKKQSESKLSNSSDVNIVDSAENVMQQNIEVTNISSFLDFINTKDFSTKKQSESKPSDSSDGTKPFYSSDVPIINSVYNEMAQSTKISEPSSFLNFTNTKDYSINKQSESSDCAKVGSANSETKQNTEWVEPSAFLDITNTEDCNTNEKFEAKTCDSSDIAAVDSTNNGIQQNIEVSEPSGFLDFVNIKDFNTNKQSESKQSESSDGAFIDSANTEMLEPSDFLDLVNTENCTNKQSGLKLSDSDSSNCVIVDSPKLQPNTELFDYLGLVNTNNQFEPSDASHTDKVENKASTLIFESADSPDTSVNESESETKSDTEQNINQSVEITKIGDSPISSQPELELSRTSSGIESAIVTDEVIWDENNKEEIILSGDVDTEDVEEIAVDLQPELESSISAEIKSDEANNHTNTKQINEQSSSAGDVNVEVDPANMQPERNYISTNIESHAANIQTNAKQIHNEELSDVPGILGCTTGCMQAGCICSIFDDNITESVIMLSESTNEESQQNEILCNTGTDSLLVPGTQTDKFSSSEFESSSPSRSSTPSSDSCSKSAENYLQVENGEQNIEENEQPDSSASVGVVDLVHYSNNDYSEAIAPEYAPEPSPEYDNDMYRYLKITEQYFSNEPVGLHVNKSDPCMSNLGASNVNELQEISDIAELSAQYDDYDYENLNPVQLFDDLLLSDYNLTSSSIEHSQGNNEPVFIDQCTEDRSQLNTNHKDLTKTSVTKKNLVDTQDTSEDRSIPYKRILNSKTAVIDNKQNVNSNCRGRNSNLPKPAHSSLDLGANQIPWSSSLDLGANQVINKDFSGNDNNLIARHTTEPSSQELKTLDLDNQETTAQQPEKQNADANTEAKNITPDCKVNDGISNLYEDLAVSDSDSVYSCDEPSPQYSPLCPERCSSSTSDLEALPVINLDENLTKYQISALAVETNENGRYDLKQQRSSVDFDIENTGKTNRQPESCDLEIDNDDEEENITMKKLPGSSRSDSSFELSSSSSESDNNGENVKQSDELQTVILKDSATTDNVNKEENLIEMPSHENSIEENNVSIGEHSIDSKDVSSEKPTSLPANIANEEEYLTNQSNIEESKGLQVSVLDVSISEYSTNLEDVSSENQTSLPADINVEDHLTDEQSKIEQNNPQTDILDVVSISEFSTDSKDDSSQNVKQTEKQICLPVLQIGKDSQAKEDYVYSVSSGESSLENVEQIDDQICLPVVQIREDSRAKEDVYSSGESSVDTNLVSNIETDLPEPAGIIIIEDDDDDDDEQNSKLPVGSSEDFVATNTEEYTKDSDFFADEEIIELADLLKTINITETEEYSSNLLIESDDVQQNEHQAESIIMQSESTNEDTQQNGIVYNTESDLMPISGTQSDKFSSSESDTSSSSKCSTSSSDSSSESTKNDLRVENGDQNVDNEQPGLSASVGVVDIVHYTASEPSQEDDDDMYSYLKATEQYFNIESVGLHVVRSDPLMSNLGAINVTDLQEVNDIAGLSAQYDDYVHENLNPAQLFDDLLLSDDNFISSSVEYSQNYIEPVFIHQRTEDYRQHNTNHEDSTAKSVMNDFDKNLVDSSQSRSVKTPLMEDRSIPYKLIKITFSNKNTKTADIDNNKNVTSNCLVSQSNLPKTASSPLNLGANQIINDDFTGYDAKEAVTSNSKGSNSNLPKTSFSSLDLGLNQIINEDLSGNDNDSNEEQTITESSSLELKAPNLDNQETTARQPKKQNMDNNTESTNITPDCKVNDEVSNLYEDLALSDSDSENSCDEPSPLYSPICSERSSTLTPELRAIPVINLDEDQSSALPVHKNEFYYLKQQRSSSLDVDIDNTGETNKQSKSCDLEIADNDDEENITKTKLTDSSTSGSCSELSSSFSEPDSVDENVKQTDTLQTVVPEDPATTLIANKEVFSTSLHAESIPSKESSQENDSISVPIDIAIPEDNLPEMQSKSVSCQKNIVRNTVKLENTSTNEDHNIEESDHSNSETKINDREDYNEKASSSDSNSFSLQFSPLSAKCLSPPSNCVLHLSPEKNAQMGVNNNSGDNQNEKYFEAEQLFYFVSQETSYDLSVSSPQFSPLSDRHSPQNTGANIGTLNLSESPALHVLLDENGDQLSSSLFDSQDVIDNRDHGVDMGDEQDTQSIEDNINLADKKIHNDSDTEQKQAKTQSSTQANISNSNDLISSFNQDRSYVQERPEVCPIVPMDADCNIIDDHTEQIEKTETSSQESNSSYIHDHSYTKNNKTDEETYRLLHLPPALYVDMSLNGDVLSISAVDPMPKSKNEDFNSPQQHLHGNLAQDDVQKSGASSPENNSDTGDNDCQQSKADNLDLDHSYNNISTDEDMNSETQQNSSQDSSLDSSVELSNRPLRNISEEDADRIIHLPPALYVELSNNGDVLYTSTVDPTANITKDSVKQDNLVQASSEICYNSHGVETTTSQKNTANLGSIPQSAPISLLKRSNRLRAISEEETNRILHAPADLYVDLNENGDEIFSSAFDDIPDETVNNQSLGSATDLQSNLAQTEDSQETSNEINEANNAEQELVNRQSSSEEANQHSNLAQDSQLTVGK